MDRLFSPPPPRRRILIIGEGAVPSGYARVIRSIFSRLTGELEIHQLATRWDGGAHDWPWPLVQGTTAGDLYGHQRIASLVDELRPDVVFALYDLSLLGPVVRAVRCAAHQPPIAVYAPVESGPLAPELLAPVAAADRIATYTPYAKRVMEECGVALPPIDVVPHGVDTRLFHPIEGGRAEARRRMGIDQDLFVVLNANRNMPRKCIDVTMHAFARFAAGKPPNVRLWLHMGVEDRGWNVVILARRLGIEDRLMLTTAELTHPAASDQELNLLYNACDVGVNTASGEAWGLVNFEHAATGAAQVVPDHTAQSELWRGSAELVPPVYTSVNTTILNSAHHLAPGDVAAALERLYSDPAHRARMAAAAFANATRPEYAWDAVAAQWRRILLALVS